MLHVDRCSKKHGNGAGFILITSGANHVKWKYALRFGLKALNKEAKHKELITGLKMVKALRAWRLHIYNDSSQLVVKQVTLEYQDKSTNIVSYLKKVKELLERFEKQQIAQIHR